MGTLGRWFGYAMVAALVGGAVSMIALALASIGIFPASIGAGLFALSFGGGPFVCLFTFLILEWRHHGRERAPRDIRAQRSSQSG